MKRRGRSGTVLTGEFLIKLGFAAWYYEALPGPDTMQDAEMKFYVTSGAS